MTVTYSDPVKNADINKSKAALVEIIDELRTRFARKNDAWSEAEALAASRLELMQAQDKKIKVCQFCYQRKHTEDCIWGKALGTPVEELGDDND
jgi:hypothetical protein